MPSAALGESSLKLHRILREVGLRRSAPAKGYGLTTHGLPKAVLQQLKSGATRFCSLRLQEQPDIPHA